MNQNKQSEIEKTIGNPIIQSMKPGQEALKSTISKAGQKKIAANQISTGMDKRESKLGSTRESQ
ncbi:MAG: hypothetical protein M0P94_02595 [Candidatus Absconditabacterales bacterium]|nr:hypothetical protein [Candidatus Absconditabacterales bacterium]